MIVSGTLDKKTKKLLADPQVLTRGFIYVKENLDIVMHISELAKEVIEKNINNGKVDFTSTKNAMREELGKYFYKETGSIPMIITVVSEI